MRLNARARRYLRRATKAPDDDPSQLGDELNIVPYLDIVVNLIMFLLMVISSVAFYTQLDTSLASLDDTPTIGPHVPSVNFSVTLADGGIVVASVDGVLATGCRAPRGETGGFSVPRSGQSYDWHALGACAAEVKSRHPHLSTVTLSADPRVPYGDLVAAMDALRRNGGRELFPDVVLSAGLR